MKKAQQHEYPVRAMKARFTALAVGCFLLAGAITTRALYIQIVGDPRLASMAKRQFQSRVLVSPRRGSITDRNGEALAINVETQSLAANPSKVASRKTLARLLAKATGVPYETLLRRLSEKREFVWIKRHLTEEEMTALRRWQVMQPSGAMADGLWLVKESQRAYPHGELAGQILGSVNIDSEGLEGAELWLNDRLRGEVVSVSAIRDALGRPTFLDAEAARDIKDGKNIALTIDASLQFEVEQALHNAVRKANARSGLVIVMDATTGEILAMANEPSYNPANKKAPAASRRNRAFTDGYEPGSTLKAILLASALSKGMKLTDVVHGENGQMTLQGRKISEAEAHEKFQWISLKKLLQVSSNVGAAKLALKVGADQYLSTLQSLAIGERSGAGFPGEIAGKIPPRKKWQPLTLANIGFGQGVLVTPMQMLRAYAAIYNGGWLVRPSILKEDLLAEAAGADPGSPPMNAPRRVFTEKVASGVLDALESVTEEGGTGVKAAVEGYAVAGKTGTAQVVDPNTGTYSRHKYIASFIGGVLDVQPKLVILTLIDEPKGIIYASETTAPLFREVAQIAATRYNWPADPKRLAAIKKDRAPAAEAAPVKRDELQWASAQAVVPAEPLKWSSAEADGTVVWTMPLLKGLSPREALKTLQGHRFEIEIQGAGLVKGQFPEEGKPVKDGSAIKLVLAEP